MKEAGDVSLEDVVEVVVRASDVVEGVHSREGVLLVEGGEGDQSAVVWESSTFLIPIFVLADPQAAGSGDRGGGSGEDPVLQDSSERPKKKTTRKQDLPDGAPRYGPQTPEFYASMLRNSGRRREPRKARGRWPPPPPVLMTLVLLLCPPNLSREPERLVQRPRFGQLWQKCCLFPPIVLIKTNWHVCVCVNLCSLKKICISDKLNWSVCIISAHAQAMNQIKVS